MSAPGVEVRLLPREGVYSLHAAQAAVRDFHYLKKPVDPRSTPEAFGIYLTEVPGELAGYLIVGRPEATRCYVPADADRTPMAGLWRTLNDLPEPPGWYGSVEDVRTGRVECTRWQVLNLARVWIRPDFQAGGRYHWPELLPGFIDRRGTWRSRLGSAALDALAAVVGAAYLLRRPPCFLDEPYEVRWLLSYCDTRIHRGTLYRAAGWQLYRTNPAGIQTWRTPLPRLTAEEDAAVRQAAELHPRSRMHRERRAQCTLTLI